jgi:hypothetical protein
MLKPKYETSLQKLRPRSTHGLPSTDLIDAYAETDQRARSGCRCCAENGPERLPFNRALGENRKGVAAGAPLLQFVAGGVAASSANGAPRPSPGRASINPPTSSRWWSRSRREADPKAIEDAVAFCSALGKVAKVILRIRSFVATASGRDIRECVYLVKEASFRSTNWTTLDNSIGRWAAGDHSSHSIWQADLAGSPLLQQFARA